MNEFSPEDRITITQLILDVLENWRVAPADQINLLGLPEETKPRAMKRYRDGTTALPDESDIWLRVQQLAGIADALRTSYPRNPQYGSIWMHRANTRFGDRSPLASMLEDGLDGMIAIHMHLDCSYDWFVDDRRAAQQPAG
jgi:hypothetical protein